MCSQPIPTEARNAYTTCMDEITIGEKVYVSSKRAAKITGYAKDYVGQLCREGRVEARLVGRNWYVLESALMEHRFGKEEEEAEEAPAVVVPAVTDSAAAWKRPAYVAETAAYVPPLEPKPAPVGSPAVADMQSAWREWFAERTPEPAAPVEEPVYAPVAPQQAYEEVEEEETVSISRITQTPVQEPEEAVQASPEEETVILHRSYAAHTVSDRIPTVAPVDLTRTMHPSTTPRYTPAARRTVAPVREKSSVILQASLLVLALAVALIAIIGTGNADRLFMGTSFNLGVQNAIVDFLGGTSTVNNSL